MPYIYYVRLYSSTFSIDTMILCICLVEMMVLQLIDARVYCKDSNASPWVISSFTCPVVCQNIISAIARLKLMDFENIIDEHATEVSTTIRSIKLLYVTLATPNKIESKDAMNEINKGQKHYKRKKYMSRKSSSNDYKIANNSIDDKQLYKDVIQLSRLGKKTFKDRCPQIKRRGMMTTLLKCARKANYDGSFLSIMTNMLNKYGKLKYKFTEDMTEILLEKILGKNTDLRNSIFDVNKLLKYLRQAINSHKKHESSDIISIKPKRCLTISLPGCFCKSGFVENSGQCVKPADCVDEATDAEYLPRVVVL